MREVVVLATLSVFDAFHGVDIVTILRYLHRSYMFNVIFVYVGRVRSSGSPSRGTSSISVPGLSVRSHVHLHQIL